MKNKNLTSNNQKFLLALHSSTESLGIGLTELNNHNQPSQSSTIKIGRNLSNYLFRSIEEIFPSVSWQQIARLAVATGPGGFTGTRMTLIFARTIAQQLKCPIDGVSSFELMAYRLIKMLNKKEIEEPFWIKQNLKHRGVVAGKYQLIKHTEKPDMSIIKELKEPHLIKPSEEIYPTLDASEDVAQDIKRLLKICLDSYMNNKEGSWTTILPIYPTSPIRN